jgi:hypothetical protein
MHELSAWAGGVGGIVSPAKSSHNAVRNPAWNSAFKTTSGGKSPG